MKKTRLLWMIAIMVLIVSMLVACTPEEPAVKEYTVTYKDGETVLDTKTVKEGELAPDFTPTKDGYTFVGWYGEPTLTHEFDFTQGISADTTIFAGFSAEAVADTRDFYIVGSGTSPLLLASNWGNVITDDHKLTKSADANVYTITLDLYEDDAFQFAIDTSWRNQRGYGYLTETKIGEEDAFTGAGTIGENSAKRQNIVVAKSGNYTFTLTTHPADDTYESDHASYTEASKENFNINPYDTIAWVRNGDVTAVVETVTDFYIKGSGITGWKDVYSPATKMTNTDGVYTLSVYLKADEEFMFTSQVTVGETVSTGTTYLRASNLDEASEAYLDATASYNMVAKAAGTYTFTYTASTEVLSVAFDATVVPADADYYIDGTFADGVADWSGYCFNDTFKLVETETDSGIFELKNVALKADSQIIVQQFKAGATERGEWGTETYNGLGSFNYGYLVDSTENFSAVGGGNNNIKVLVAGNYDITFNEYTKVLTIKTSAPVGYDVFIKGGMNSWDHAFNTDYQLTETEGVYEITLAFEVDWEFGLAGFASNDHTGYGDWIGKANIGTAGDSNELFVSEAGNLKCETAGTYKIVFTKATNTIDIYAVVA